MPATFFSRHHSLRLIRKNAIRKMTEFGAQDTEVEMVVEFEPGAGKVTVHEDGRVEPANAYRNGEWELPDGPNGTPQTLLEWLRNHREFGALFHEESIPTPEPTIELAELAKLAAGQDVDGIVALGERENGTWQRPEVFAAIDSALETIREVAPDKVKHLLAEAK